jgi:TP901 family phage tail tape measure protein
MADNLRLRVVLDFVDRALGPLRRVSDGSRDAARALKAAKESLKALNAQQAQVGEFRTLKGELQDTAAKLAQARGRVGELARVYGQTAEPTRAMTQELAKAKREAAALGNQHDTQQVKLQQLRAKLSAAGISTRDLANHSQRLRTDIAAANSTIEQQTAKLKANGEQQRKLAELRKRHGNEMMHTGMIAAGSAALMAGGNKMAGPLRSVVGAFMPAEVSETQLRASMMGKAGEVGAEFQQIVDLATRLGDRLPGTTAEFIDMMTMLRRQGMASKAILGGLGESAAYLGIQLRMPVTAAAEFAAKMQDATQTAEGDMMGLMDVIQRAFYLGVDPTNMLQGFTKMSAVMPFLGEEGLKASNMLAPLLVMMDQTGMAGESAGNAIRKVVQLSLDAEKLAKTNKMLAGEGIELNFATKGGKFAGLDNLFAQLDKLKGVDSDVKRIAALKKLYGDDAETHQVINTLMEKGLDGYREVVAKMEAQADLRKRVDSQLKTLSASVEAAQGSFTNMLKDMGATIAPDLVLIVGKLGDMANAVGAWTRENQTAVKWALRVVAVLAIGATALGAIGLAYASVMGPMLLFRFGLARLAFLLPGVGKAAGLLVSGLGFVLGALKAVALFLLANPIVLVIAAIAAAAFLIWRNWDTVKGFLLAIWAQLAAAAAALWASATAGAAALWQTLVSLKDRFMTAGADLMQGLVNGIISRVQAVRDAIVGVADAVGGWFREKLGIASPSKVFMQYGGWISEGAALGIAGGQGAVRTAALAMATAATATMPMAADAAALRIDSRAPLMAHGAGMGAPMGGGTTISITVNAAPGMDEKALARAVAAEVRRLQQADRSRVNSQYSDIDG